jgi:hypothetical protein
VLPAYAVDFRGRPACPCQAEWLPAFEHEAQRRGILAGPLPIAQLIGGAPASGGTHVAGGAADWSHVDGLVWLARQMGADATWFRPELFRDGVRVWPEHDHSVLRGCAHNEPARYQIDAVDDGFDGLGAGGRGGPDDGPRPLSLRTWREGIAWARQAEEDDMEITDEQMNEIARRTVDALLARELTVTMPDETKSKRSVQQVLRETWQRVSKG